jgi:phosphatidate phosphatase PAH1
MDRQCAAGGYGSGGGGGLFLVSSKVTPFYSPLHAKFDVSSTMRDSGRQSGSKCTVTVSFNSVPHHSQIATIDDSGRVFWNDHAPQVRLPQSPLLPSAFRLQNPLPPLNHGPNTLTLTLTRTHLPPSSIESRVFFWELPPLLSRRLVVVDIDGTITRSDVGGHVLPLFGMSWAQPGVVPLMRAIASNGYHIVYLTSRPLFLADRTRSYLARLGMPLAPVVTSPDDALKSLHREITGCAHVFKSSVLAGISDVFRHCDGGDYASASSPSASGATPAASVFHSAFGNRATDAKAYAAAGIEPHRTFIIDARGRVVCADGAIHVSGGSYAAMLLSVNELFPPMSM